MFLADAIHDKLSHICLAHLSKNNNSPERALQTLHQTISQKGIVLDGKTQVVVLNRNLPTDVIRLGD
jgi:hypothetical protein